LDSDVPLYEQLRNEIVLGIAKGKLQPNEKLPTVRQLAEELGINTMTVNKAYALLKQEHYIFIDRRHGAKVNGDLFTQEERTEASNQLEQKLELMIAEATLEGIAMDTFQQLCHNIFAKMTIKKA